MLMHYKSLYTVPQPAAWIFLFLHMYSICEAFVTQISSRRTPLKRAWEEATLLVECAQMLRGEGRPRTSYSSKIASLTQWEILCFDVASPQRPAPKHTSNWGDFLQSLDRSTYIFKARTGQSMWSFSSSPEAKGGGWKEWSVTTWEWNDAEKFFGT